VIDRNRADSIVWQECEDGLVPEMPIALRYWEGGPQIELRQNENSILLNIETIPDLIKAMKELAVKKEVKDGTD
jgi:hypothetical protein